MVSDELIKRIYENRLSHRKRGKPEIIARCPRVTYRAIQLTGDLKLANSFLDTHSANGYSDLCRRECESYLRNVAPKFFSSHNIPKSLLSKPWKSLTKNFRYDENRDEIIQTIEQIIDKYLRRKEHYKRKIIPLRTKVKRFVEEREAEERRYAKLEKLSDESRVPPPVLSREEEQEFGRRLWR